MAIHGGWLATPSTPPGSVPEAKVASVTMTKKKYSLLQFVRMDAADAAMKEKVITEDIVETIPTMHVSMNVFAHRV